MKAFFISTLIFLAMVLLVFYNYIYINGTSDRLEELTVEILFRSENLNEATSNLEEFWNKHKNKLDLTVNHQIVNSIGIKVTNIRLFVDNADYRQLERELLLLKEEIKELRRPERFALGNIF